MIEQRASKMLDEAWIDIYHARSLLGKEHPEYEEMSILLAKITCIQVYLIEPRKECDKNEHEQG